MLRVLIFHSSIPLGCHQGVGGFVSLIVVNIECSRPGSELVGAGFVQSLEVGCIGSGVYLV